MISRKINFYSVKYICIQSKIYEFNEKYFYSILLFFLFNKKSHENIVSSNGTSSSGYFLPFTNVQLIV